MFNIVGSVVSCLMVAGKLSILLAVNSANASTFEEQKFFEYRSGGVNNRIVDVAFGWFKTLDTDQKLAYNQALTHALVYADNGQAVRWYKDAASGVVVPSMTWPSNGGYCRRIYVQTIAFGVEKNNRATACFNETDNRWVWVN